MLIKRAAATKSMSSKYKSFVFPLLLPKCSIKELKYLKILKGFYNLPPVLDIFSSSWQHNFKELKHLG